MEPLPVQNFIENIRIFGMIPQLCFHIGFYYFSFPFFLLFSIFFSPFLLCGTFCRFLFFIWFLVGLSVFLMRCLFWISPKFSFPLLNYLNHIYALQVLSHMSVIMFNWSTIFFIVCYRGTIRYECTGISLLVVHINYTSVPRKLFFF